MWSDKNKKKKFSEKREHHWDEFQKNDRMSKRSHYQRLLQHYYKFHIPEGSNILELGSGRGDLISSLNPSKGVGVDLSSQMTQYAKSNHPQIEFICADVHDIDLKETFDFIILSDLLNDVWDAQWIIKVVNKHSNSSTRIIINTHNRLWQPILQLASKLGLATPSRQQNWLAKNDIINLLQIENFDIVKTTSEVLLPINIPLITKLFNRYIAKITPFKWFNLFHVIIARRPVKTDNKTVRPGVSVIVAARNEEGNVPYLFKRIPQMGSGTEIIFVEGGSSDNTFGAIEHEMTQYTDLNVKLFKQPGKGKGDAVRVGFDAATKDILMILDADMTVSPEDLPRFYEALISGKGEFINGVRLVYPMEKEAMRFFNIIGNKFFSLVFSWILGQPVKDTLCGTKVMTKANYQKIADNRSYFGDFDPFGDFDLIFGAAKQNLKIIDMPIRYGERTYGDTNIDRWKAGVLLLRMSIFAAKRLKFL